MGFLAALQFLTTIPVPWLREVSPEKLGRSVGYFPVVGLVIGLILVGLDGLFSFILPPSVTNILLLVSLVIITGAMHLDGFVDTCDGIAGHKMVEVRWQVMHDSRVGGFGIIGIVLLLLVKYVSLNNISASFMTPVLVLMPVLGRWAMVYAIFTLPYARPSGLGKVFKQETRWPMFALAMLVTLIVMVGLVWVTGFLLVFLIWFLIWVMTVAVAAYFKSKFVGLTGDTYGAINEVTETGVLVLASWLFGVG